MTWDTVARERLHDRIPKLDRYGKASVERCEDKYDVTLQNRSLGLYRYHRDAARLRNAVNTILKEYE